MKNPIYQELFGSDSSDDDEDIQEGLECPPLDPAALTGLHVSFNTVDEFFNDAGDVTDDSEGFYIQATDIFQSFDLNVEENSRKNGKNGNDGIDVEKECLKNDNRGEISVRSNFLNGKKHGRGKVLETLEKSLKPCSNWFEYKSQSEVETDKKFESAKRKIHDAYENIEQAKKRKRIKLVDFQDLPRHTKSIKFSSKKNCEFRCRARNVKLATPSFGQNFC